MVQARYQISAHIYKETTKEQKGKRKKGGKGEKKERKIYQKNLKANEKTKFF